MVKANIVKNGKSLLLWKAPKSKIDAKTLGVVRPDGVVIYQSPEMAELYAKNRVIDALKGPKPFERGILLKDNLVIAEKNGDASSIEIGEFGDNLEKMVFVHGHPDNGGSTKGTLPISVNDYLVMNYRKLSKVVAYNLDGEYSQLTAVPTESLLIRLCPKKWHRVLKKFESYWNFIIVADKYSDDYASLFPKKLRKAVALRVHRNLGSANGEGYYFVKLTPEQEKEISTRNREILLNGDLAKTIHKFWQKMSAKLGIKYETNFSNLAD